MQLNNILLGGGSLLLLALSWLITWWMCHHAKIQDEPNERSLHLQRTPRGGGVAIVATFVAGVVACYATIDASVNWPLFFIFSIGGVIVAIVSLLDDISNYSYQIKIIIHSIVIIAVLTAGLGLQQLQLPWIGFIELGLLGYVVSFLWIFGLTNAYNFMDGIDGLAGSTALIVSAFFAYITYAQGSPFLHLISISILIGSAGFLYWNIPPARIFMGDVGSTFLGFTFAGMAIFATQYDASNLSILVMPLLLFHYIFDTVFTMGRRISVGKNPAQAHHSHIYQLLIRLKYSHGRVTSTFALLALIQGIATIYMVQLDNELQGYIFLPFLFLYALAAWWITNLARKQELIP